MNPKKEFISIFKENIKREGADKLLEYLLSEASDFFIAPASTRFHGSYECGLVMHSLNVYFNLCDYLKRARCLTEYKLRYCAESVAIVALLHDICKVNCYKIFFRNVKNEYGQWDKVAAFTFDDEPYGHGEKSVYIISQFMKLTPEEAYAIRYHMGFSQNEDANQVPKAFKKHPLSLALYIADMEASNFLDDEKELEIEKY